MKRSVRFITRAALIAALYFGLTVSGVQLSFGPVQFRISEALTLLPVIFPEAIPGLTIGCLFANLFFSPYGVFDAIIGTSATLIASILTYLLRKKIVLASFPPILLNAFLIPIIYILDGTPAVYWSAMLEILGTEALMVWVGGIPLTLALKKAFLHARIAFADSSQLPRLKNRALLHEVYTRQAVSQLPPSQLPPSQVPQSQLFLSPSVQSPDAQTPLSDTPDDSSAPY